jgi:hypothetical protein
MEQVQACFPTVFAPSLLARFSSPQCAVLDPLSPLLLRSIHIEPACNDVSKLSAKKSIDHSQIALIYLSHLTDTYLASNEIMEGRKYA